VFLPLLVKEKGQSDERPLTPHIPHYLNAILPEDRYSLKLAGG